MTWFILASVVSASCTRVLGIDGKYVIASAGGAGTGGTSGASGTTSSGGTLGGGGAGNLPGSGDGGRDSGPSTSGNGGTTDEPDAAPPLGGASAGGTATSGGAPNSGGVTNSGGAPTSFDAGRDGATSTVCRTGSYAGRFKGTVQFPPIPDVPNVPIPVQGDVTLDVAPGRSATLFEVTGKLGPDSQTPLDGFVPFSSDVAGTLDCATGVLAANLDNGQVRSLVVYAFEGTLTATYDYATQEFTGSWSESESGPPPAGSGTGDISTVVWKTP